MKLKLGPHHITGGFLNRDWTALAGLTVAKYVGDLGAGSEAPATVLTIGRVVDDGQLDGQGFDMNRMAHAIGAEAAADQYMVLLAPVIRLNPWIRAWEGPNEQVFIYDAEQERDPVRKLLADADRRFVMSWYANFLYALAERLHDVGKIAVLGSWSAGNPRKELDLWPWYVPALRAGRDFGAFQARHDYGMEPDGSIRTEYDQAQSHALGYPDTRWIITECGMDAVSWIPGSGPWRKYYGSMSNYWGGYLLPFLERIHRLPYVFGATLFTEGGHGGWVDFDMNGTDIVARLATYIPPDEEASDMDEALRLQIRAEANKALDAANKILQLTEPGADVPWWQKLILPAPAATAIPNKPLVFRRADGTAIVPNPRPNVITYSLGIFEVNKVLGLVRVTQNQVSGQHWWVLASELNPAR